MHPAAMEWIGRFATDDEVRVLDVGGRNINGTPREFFPNATDYVVVDLVDHRSVDVVADVLDLKPTGKARLSVGLFDVIVYAEVAEHTEDWPAHLEHLDDLLADGGRCVVTAAGPTRTPHSSVDGGRMRDGEYYQNLTRDGLESVLYGIADGAVVDVAGHDIRAEWRKVGRG